MSDLFQEQLQALRARSLHRKLREIGTAQGSEVQIVGRQLVNFSSNDYLGLADDPILRQAAIAAIEQFGVGAGASRLISGTQSPHVALEAALARWKRAPAALAFSSGYAAAVGTLPALACKHDVVILDKLSHASLIDGARLSGATMRVFPAQPSRQTGKPPRVGAAGTSRGAPDYRDRIGLQHGWRPGPVRRIGRAEEALRSGPASR